MKLKDQDLDATKEAKDVAIEVLSRARNRPNFGNAGEVENIISHAKDQQQARQSKGLSTNSFDVVFEPQDFDQKFDRGNHATTNLKKLFEDVIGCEDVVAKLENYQQTAQNMKRRHLNYRDLIPTNFLFKGPPGKLCDHQKLIRSILLNLWSKAPEKPQPLVRWAKYSMIWVFCLL